MATKPKTIVVLGATGNQGGSVADSFLADEHQWNVRGITRNAGSVRAKALATRGVQVVEADMSNPTTLRKAFDNAHVIFAVSDFLGIYFDTAHDTEPRPGQARNAWAGECEYQQLKNVIDEAAKVPTLERFIFSSLSDVKRWSYRKYNHVYHFQGKADAENYGRTSQPDLWAKTSVIQAGLFLENYISPAHKPKKGQSGETESTCMFGGDLKLPWLAVAVDTGPLVKTLVEDTPGKNLLGYRAWATEREVVDAISQASGLAIRAKSVPIEEWAARFPPDLAGEMIEHAGYWREFGFEAQEDPVMCHPRDLQPAVRLPTVADWAAAQNWTEIIDGSV